LEDNRAHALLRVAGDHPRHPRLAGFSALEDLEETADARGRLAHTTSKLANGKSADFLATI
jgi:hypothetical protein